MHSEFIDLGFEKYFYAKGMPSIAGQFTLNNRCGIYILHFENGEYYVGLANNVVKRYAQHRLNHSDIEFVSFKEVSKSKLGEIEKETVYNLENLKKPLRNLNIVSIILGDTDLDLIVSVQNQKRWLNYKIEIEEFKTERFDYPDLRKKYINRFDKLKQVDHYKEAVKILQAYVIETLPFPTKTEYSFWSVSCLPSTPDSPLFRVNIFWQETLVCFEEQYINKITNEVFESFTILIWLSKSIFEKHFNKEDLEKKFETLEFIDRIWEKGGQDQMCIVISAEEFFMFFNLKEIKDAIKDFNLRLFRKGGCIWNRYHCFSLADEALRLDNINWV